MLDFEIETVYRVKGCFRLFKTHEEAWMSALEQMRQEFEGGISRSKANKEAFQEKIRKLNALLDEAQNSMRLGVIWRTSSYENQCRLVSDTADVEVPIPSYLDKNNESHLRIMRDCVVVYCEGMISSLEKLVLEAEKDISRLSEKLAEVQKKADC